MSLEYCEPVNGFVFPLKNYQEKYSYLLWQYVTEHDVIHSWTSTNSNKCGQFYTTSTAYNVYDIILNCIGFA